MKNVMLLLQHVAYNVNILRSIITHVTFCGFNCANCNSYTLNICSFITVCRF